MLVVVMAAFETPARVPISKPAFLIEASSSCSCHCQDIFLYKNSSYEIYHYFIYWWSMFIFKIIIMTTVY